MRAIQARSHQCKWRRYVPPNHRYQSTRRYNPQDLTPHSHRHENFRYTHNLCSSLRPRYQVSYSNQTSYIVALPFLILNQMSAALPELSVLNLFMTAISICLCRLPNIFTSPHLPRIYFLSLFYGFVLILVTRH
jgi:hypothetical protein